MNDINFTIVNLPGGADGTENAGAHADEHNEPRHIAKDSPLDRMERDYGYEMTRDDEDCKQWISDDVTADDNGLNVKFQNVLTIRRDANNGKCWFAKFSHDRETKFVVTVYGGLSRAKAIVFDALLAWHRSAKTKKIAR